MRLYRIDVLFQDADLVWYHNPISFFQNRSSPIYDFDMYFQDDGAHSVRYAPYSPNTGFYFVRANERTRYFFSAFVKMGDIIMQSGSHQGALTAVLNEHNSYRGLKVKVLARDGDYFPGSDSSFPGGFRKYNTRPCHRLDILSVDAFILSVLRRVSTIVLNTQSPSYRHLFLGRSLCGFLVFQTSIEAKTI